LYFAARHGKLSVISAGGTPLLIGSFNGYSFEEKPLHEGVKIGAEDGEVE
jgi:hypothetical protein